MKVSRRVFRFSRLFGVALQGRGNVGLFVCFCILLCCGRALVVLIERRNETGSGRWGRAARGGVGGWVQRVPAIIHTYNQSRDGGFKRAIRLHTHIILRIKIRNMRANLFFSGVRDGAAAL